MLNRIHQDGQMTHMPFLTRDADGVKVLFYCSADLPAAPGAAQAGESRVWKLCVVTEDGSPRRLETDLPDDVVECSPTAWIDETGWHVTFIAGGGALGPRYHLYRMDGPALDRLGTPVALRQTKAGFVYRDRLVYAELEDIVHVHDTTGDTVIELSGASITRVAYHAKKPERLLVSGVWIRDDEVFTLEYDLNTRQQHFIECDGQAAYKCTVLDDAIIYAERSGDHFEDRNLRQSGATSLTPCKAAARRFAQPVPMTPEASARPCGCGNNPAAAVDATPVRPSCLECVEKHLGAAYVLLAETNDGYAHRLRAVGHLHEAEDESQEWARLHNAIRSARKAYQTHGHIPDWRGMETLIGEVRDHA